MGRRGAQSPFRLATLVILAVGAFHGSVDETFVVLDEPRSAAVTRISTMSEVWVEHLPAMQRYTAVVQRPSTNTGCRGRWRSSAHEPNYASPPPRHVDMHAELFSSAVENLLGGLPSRS